MKYFSIPADFRTETIDSYAGLNERYKNSKVGETYGQITIGSGFESGRPGVGLPQLGLNELENYIKYSKERNIDFNYTINASYMGNREFTQDGINQVKNSLHQLYEAGVRSLTVAMPSLLELVRATGLDFKIKASTICQIINANHALSFKKTGVDRIVTGESINRDFEALKEIRAAFGEKVEIIVNSICHIDCVNRMFHYNQIAGDAFHVSNDASRDYYPHRCLIKRHENMENILKLSWVRPEDIKHYCAIGINYFKLQGRQLVLNGDPVRAVECYFKEEYDGNLLDLLEMFTSAYAFRVFIDNKKLAGFLEPFYGEKGFCRHNCSTCGYCKAFAQKCMDSDKAAEISLLTNKFYSEYDRFTEMIASNGCESGKVSSEGGKDEKLLAKKAEVDDSDFGF